MYSYEERIKAVKLYEKYGKRAAAVIRELGYPDRHVLAKWYQEYISEGTLKEKITRKPKYTEEQRAAAVEFYLSHGKNMNLTIHVLGYPGRATLSQWLSEDCPEEKRTCKSGTPTVYLSQEQREQAAIDMCTRTESAQEVADRYQVSRYTVYNCQWQVFGKGASYMKKPTQEPVTVEMVEELRAEVARLAQEKAELERQVYRCQLERDVLEKAAEILKKDQGVSLKALTNREKAVVIDALRDRYKLKELLSVLHIAKSSYCYQESLLRGPDKYAALRKRIGEIFLASSKRYGYRRIYCSLKNEGIVISEKVVRTIMREESMVVPFVKMKKYSSYVGEVTPAVPNLVKRNFHADAPNKLWLTDITEFHIPAGKIYLSPMVDCFDGLPVAWTIGTSPSADLANTMLDVAISELREGEHPIVHTDRGGHYRWPGWIERMDAAGLIRSMSKKGCSPDNAACEGFHGRLKNEFFYNRDWRGVTIESFVAQLDEYLHWYSEDRIKISLNGMSPMNYRRSLGLAA